ncbi:substrate-binding domain-containing protein [uncultured Corynebacterium sp.]|uniref:substrate-binding domain-containing protein n=1 Tax=uncultured Corynebacterium sp. TaxID=159447 RepID=UPI0025DDBECD|nr:substrate-binding domain-containing protein [uncultured Corynebacterium sp.]
MFKKPLRTVAAAMTAALAVSLAACSSTGGAPRGDGDGSGGGTVDTPRYVVSMVSHGAPGDTFWDLVRKGAEDAAQKDNIELRYSSDPQAPNQAQLVQTAIDSDVDGIAVTMPNPSAIGPVAQKAVNAGIPVVGLNAGMEQYEKYGLTGFFGQEEGVAGQRAGERLGDEKARKVICVIHEQGNQSQEDRCSGVKKGLGAGGSVETLYVNGQELTSVQSTIKAKLAQDPSIDWIMSLVTPVGLVAAQAAAEAGRDLGDNLKIGTFDTNAELIPAVKEGKIEFAVDQQPYLQGYLAIDSLWLAKRNGTTVGGGRPVYTGPSFVDVDNIDTIADAAKEGLR